MPSSSPLVSVVIPSYNCARYLPEAIESVLAQTYRPVELLVVDDGSTDETPNVLRSYGGRLHALRQANAGRAAARNAGVRAAHGEYLAFLDADDIWLPLKLERQVALLESRPECAWVYSDLRRFDEQGEESASAFEREGISSPPEGMILAAVLSRWLVSTITVVARAVCFDRVGLFDPAFPVAQDYDMWIRLASEFEAGCVNEVLSLYRQHEAQVSPHFVRTDVRAAQRRLGSAANHTWRVLQKFARGRYRTLTPLRRAQLRPVLRRRLAECACAAAEGAVAGQARWAACRWLARALLLRPAVPAHRPGLLLDAMLPAALVSPVRRLARGLHAPHLPESDFAERWG